MKTFLLNCYALLQNLVFVRFLKKVQKPSQAPKLFLNIIAIAVFAWAFVTQASAQPTITTFSPTSGPVGTTVTITGTNFSPIAANNIVYFGAVKATVTAATSTSLTVVVPAGATYEPITVTAGGLTAYSSKPFNVTFAVNATGFTPGSFAPNVDFPASDGPRDVAIVDIDGDGRSDLASTNINANSISVLRNTTSNNTLAFTPKLDFPTGTQPFGIDYGDLDGDGKPDLAVANIGAGSVSLFRNISTPGTIAFAPRLDLSGIAQAYRLSIGDVDGDGKPDLVVTSLLSSALNTGSVSVFRNISTGTNLAFAPKVEYATGTQAFRVAMGDLDGDGKPELAVTNFGSQTVSLFRNISTVGTIAFAAKIDYPMLGNPAQVAIGDVDGDGKQDILISLSSNQSSPGSISVLRNTSTVGTFSFTKVDFATTVSAQFMGFGDLDGDGKPDVVVSFPISNSISILRNLSTPGMPAFASGVNYTVSSGLFNAAIADLNGDNLPDIALPNSSLNSVTVLVNQGSFSPPPPVITSFSPASGPVGSSVTITGTGFDPVAANNIVYFGAVKATVTAATSTSLTVTVPAGATYQPLSVTTNTLTAYSVQPFIVTFMNSGASFSSNSFGEKIDFSTGTGSSPFDVTLGDFDNDGKPDVAVVNQGLTSVSIFRNTGNGSVSFASKIDYPAGQAARGVASADFDGDGKLDLAVISLSSNTVSIYRNTSSPGTISFANKVDYSTGTFPFSIALGDLDADGKAELVVVNVNQNTLSIFKNVSTIGNIFFANKVDYPTGTSPEGVAVGDLDNDGKPDVLVSNFGINTLSIFRNLSSGGNIALAPKVDLASGTGPVSAAIADLDGDGKQEIVASNETANTISVFKNTGTAGTLSFTAKTDYITGNSPDKVKVGDLDGDGKVDLVASNTNSGTISVLKNLSTNSNLTFASKVDYVTGSNPQSLAIGDLDGDNRPDVTVVNRTSNTISILRNQTSPTIQQPPPTIAMFSPASGTVGTSVTITGAHFDPIAANNIVYFGAVKATVTAATSTSLSVTVPTGATYEPISVTTNNLTAYSTRPFMPTFANGCPGFAANSFSGPTTYAAGSDPRNLATADFDGDGKPDIAETNIASGTVSVFRNTSIVGTIALAAKTDFLTGAGPERVATGDFDGDGKPDMAVANGSSGSVSVFRNISSIGNISFATKIDYATGVSSRGVAVGDFNGDGKPDLVVANTNSNTISFLTNTSVAGTISFGAKVDYATGSGPHAIAVGDLDGDNRPDVAVANLNSNTISVFRNTSTTATISFATQMDLPLAGSFSYGLAIGDLDGDGKLDLAASSLNAHTVSIFRNVGTIGNIAFASRIDYSATGPLNVAIGDLNGDGKPDLAVSNFSTTNFTVLYNSSTAGTISFTNVTAFGSSNPSTNVVIVDLDGDAKPDIATSAYSINSLTVFRNQTACNTPCTPPTFASNGIIVKNATCGNNDGSIAITPATGTAPFSYSINGGVTYVSGPNAGFTFNNLAPGRYQVRIKDATGCESQIIETAVAGCSPSITNFSPTFGPVGTTVTITGTGFDPVAANNIVYFGAVKATVTAATSTSLTVTVPTNATYAPISVTVNNLTAYSSKPFTPTFANGCPAFTSTAFGSQITYPAGSDPRNLTAGDLDGDGRSEIVMTNVGSNTVSLYRNTSSNGIINFAPKVDFIAGVGPEQVVLGDFDGDGRSDIALANGGAGTVSVYKNSSTPGLINISYKTDFPTGSGTSGVATGDFNGDGKLDLVAANTNSNSIAFLRNSNGVGGINTISFAPRIEYGTGTAPNAIAVGDLDGDNKPDVAVATLSSNTIRIFRNTSTGGSISFAFPIDLPLAGTNSFGLAIGDLDSDGKLDLAASSFNANVVSVFRNVGTIGNIAFASRIDYSVTAPRNVAIADLSGDGKPDLAVSNFTTNNFSVLNNNSAIGTISFANAVSYASTPSTDIVIADLDGDTRPDIASSAYSINSLTVFKNRVECLGCTPPTFVNNGLIVKNATCGNNDASITIISTSGTPPFSYSINGGATYLNGSSSSFVFNNLAAGTYRLRLKDANGCESEIVERTVRTLVGGPKYTFKVVDATCRNSNGSITITPTSGVGPFSYSINAGMPGMTYVPGPDTGYTFTNLPANTYYLQVKGSRECESEIIYVTVKGNFSNCPSTLVQANLNPFEKVVDNEALKVYPVPNRGQFKLLLQHFAVSKAEVSVFSAKGTLIQQRSLNLTKNSTLDFDLRGKAPGLYLIKVVSGAEVRTTKVLIQ